MKSELYIARRFALKQRSSSKPTFIIMVAVLGIAVGTAALILALSIVKGFAATIEDKIIGFHGHLQVRQADGGLFYPLEADTAKLQRIDNIASVRRFMEQQVILQSGAGSAKRVQPAMIKGVDGSQPPAFLEGNIVRGQWPDSSRDQGLGLVVGSSLAEMLDIGPGSRLMIISTSHSQSGGFAALSDSIVDLLSELEIEIATVSGIYQTGLNEGFDDFMVMADLQQLQQRFASNRITGYEIMTERISDLDKTTRAAAESLGYPFYSYTVYERYNNLFEWLKLQQNITPLLIITITIVAVFNIMSTLLVLIIEKTREIGMLMALGCPPPRLSRVFLFQAGLIAGIGIAAGNLLALGYSLFELRFHLITLPEKNYFIKHLPILIDPVDYLLVSAVVAVLTIVFAMVPARVASSLKPANALLT
ncbi:MAG: ABC transporter permease [Prosthecochloris sp.]|nr:ABC transporter permease [Prosthecochloris sp.]